jgi:hypothetical protein
VARLILTPDTTQAVLAGLRQGIPAYVLAEAHGVSASTVSLLKKKNLPDQVWPRWAARVHTPGFIAHVRDLWAAGLPISQIGGHLGVTRNVVVGIAQRNGFPGRPSPIRRAAS